LLSAPLGRILEISIGTPVIRESLDFYESLGFVQAAAGETWSHPYAVVTDGHLFIGLHGREMPSPSLTFVLPELQLGVGRLKERGVAFAEERFSEDVFNQAQLLDPGGLSVTLLEARTFSPPQLDARIESACGYFSELGIPARATDAARAFSGSRSASSRSKRKGSRFRARRWSAMVWTLRCTAPAHCVNQYSRSRTARCRSGWRGCASAAYRCPTRCRTLWTSPAMAC
jgi:hypothetical protein